MKATSAIVCGLVSAVALSCAIAPVKVASGDQCFRCRRLITDPRVAAETIGRSGLVSKFKGPGCMATYLATHPPVGDALFVTDFTSGKMIAPERARFVPVVVNPDTGERDFVAYLDAREADAAALDFKTAATNWQGVLDFGRTQ
ncbi:MAG TPA: hypothetical protein VEU08_05110 [Vicinamibacterales bacterium]|nr:hypothetical protein [Vicinamibacterales bacterium]